MRYARSLVLSLLTLSVLAGCGTQTGTTWRHETVAGAKKAAAKAAAKATPKPAASAPATTPSTAPASSTTFSFVATLDGAALPGYAVEVYDARNGQRFETGATVQAVDATTGGNGQFTVKVSGVPAGQALRVVASKSGFAVEAIVTAKTDAAQTVTLDETSTLLARVAAGPLAASQVLLSAEAAPVVNRVNELQLLRQALSAQMNLANGYDKDLNRPEDRGAQSKSVRQLLNAAGLTEEMSEFEAELVAQTAKLAADEAKRSDAVDDADVLAELADVELVGTVLRASYDEDKAAFTLKNSADNSQIDAATGAIANVLRVVRR